MEATSPESAEKPPGFESLEHGNELIVSYLAQNMEGVFTNLGYTEPQKIQTRKAYSLIDQVEGRFESNPPHATYTTSETSTDGHRSYRAVISGLKNGGYKLLASTFGDINNFKPAEVTSLAWENLGETVGVLELLPDSCDLADVDTLVTNLYNGAWDGAVPSRHGSKPGSMRNINFGNFLRSIVSRGQANYRAAWIDEGHLELAVETDAYEKLNKHSPLKLGLVQEVWRRLPDAQGDDETTWSVFGKKPNPNIELLKKALEGVEKKTLSGVAATQME